MHTCKPGIVFFFLVFQLPSPPPLTFVERVATVAAWAVTQAVSYFIIACISSSSLMAPVDTAHAGKYALSVRTAWPSTLALSSMMRSDCVLVFSYSNAAYSIAAVKLSSAVVAVAPPWGDLRVWGRGALQNMAPLL